jgi:anti-sigma factor RsiW
VCAAEGGETVVNCSWEAIERYHDGESDAAARREMEEHAAGCGACATRLAELEGLRVRVREEAPYYRASGALRMKLGAALRAEEAGRAWPAAARWGAMAAAILVAAMLGWTFGRRGEPDLVARDVVSSHVRSLMGTRLVDVPSSDRHTVRPWFNGKLDFSPEVKDLAAVGFPLLGGRVDYVGGRRVAALVYGRGNHTINLFLWPSEGGGAGEESRNGFHILHWSAAGMSAWAVSDAAVEELRRFAEEQRK